jgi:uncharacterized membrane protein
MNPDKPRITAKIAGRPLHPLLRPFAIVYFLAACGCDLLFYQASVFAREGSPEFVSITEWLIGVGLIMATVTALVALVDYLGDVRFRRLPDAGTYALGTALAVLIELHNLDLRWSEGASAIAPMGAILSLSAVVVLLATPTHSWARLYH